MGVQLLSESLVWIGKTEWYQPEDALHEGLEPAAGVGARGQVPMLRVSGLQMWQANVSGGC